jgi:ABC-type multidrug transport system fused ATPase/permease subunit
LADVVPAQQPTSWALYRRLLRYVRPYWRVFGLAAVAMVVVAGSDYVMATLVAPLIQNFQQPDPAMMFKLPLLIAACSCCAVWGPMSATTGWRGSAIGSYSTCARRWPVICCGSPRAYYDDQSAGVLISRLTHDAQQIASASSSAITAVIRNGLSMLAMIVFLLQTNWRLTLILFVMMPVVAAVIRYFSRRLRRSARNVQGAMGKLTHVLEEIVNGNRIVKIFGGQAYETRRVVDASNKASPRRLEAVVGQRGVESHYTVHRLDRGRRHHLYRVEPESRRTVVGARVRRLRGGAAQPAGEIARYLGGQREPAAWPRRDGERIRTPRHDRRIRSGQGSARARARRAALCRRVDAIRAGTAGRRSTASRCRYRRGRPWRWSDRRAAARHR